MFSEKLMDSTYSQISGKEKSKLILLAYENNQDEDAKQGDLIQSKEIICPQWYEITTLKIKDYHIILSGCKNGHEINLPFDRFEKSQMIDESKIICENCKNSNKANSYKNQFYFCNECH